LSEDSYKENGRTFKSIGSNNFELRGDPKILIVDDEPFNLIALEGMLLQRGYTRIDKAFNGQEALQKIAMLASG
jgi:PleD family two-component response regulator